MTEADTPITVRDVYLWDHDRLWRALYAFTGSREQTDDVVAEVFAQALVREGTLRDTTTWVWRSAFEVAPAPRVGAPGGPTEADDLLHAQRTVLDALGTGDRRLLAWHHVGGWSAAEIASAVDTTRWSTAWRLRRAQRRARAALATAGGPAPDDPVVLFRGFDGIRVPDQWDEITARLDTDELVQLATRGSGRSWIAIAAIVAVLALVAALVVITADSSTPAQESGSADSTALPVATIGDGRDVTIALTDLDDGSSAGTFRLRLYENAGATVLEYEDVDVVPADGVQFVVIELDGRVGVTAPYTTGSIGSVQLFEGTLTTPFTVRLSLTGADDATIQSSDTVELRPDL